MRNNEADANFGGISPKFLSKKEQILDWSEQYLEIGKHLPLGGSSGLIDQLLSDASACHFRFDIIQSRFIFAYVVGHVAIGVDG